jgi:hypothetical protein
MTTNFIFLGIIFLVIILAKQPVVKGKIGEIIVTIFLKLMLDKNEYHIINNLTISDGQGGTTQIDHLVVSKYGIFVIETKNMRGWIYGDEKVAKWTQVIFKVKNSFQNPLRQNYKHIICLAQLLGLPKENFIHVIVFVGNCTLKNSNKLPDNILSHGGQISQFIRSKTVELFDPNQVITIIDSIKNIQLSRSFKTNREHVKYVKGIVAAKEKGSNQVFEASADKTPVETSSTPVCTKCGVPMVLRVGEKGKNAGNKFWGCNNYPKCRSILKISTAADI